MTTFGIVAAATLAATAGAVIVHFEGLAALGRYLARLRERTEVVLPARRTLIKLLTSLFSLHVVQIVLFGLVYWSLSRWIAGGAEHGGALALGDALHLSAITFTTVGYGDISPTGALRFVAAIEALLGFMLLTWSASFAYLQMARQWRDGPTR